MYHYVPDGRIGVTLVGEKKDKNFTLSEFALTREDIQVSNSTLQSSLILVISIFSSFCLYICPISVVWHGGVVFRALDL